MHLATQRARWRPAGMLIRSFGSPLGNLRIVKSLSGLNFLTKFPADFKISIFRLFRPWRCPGQALETHSGDPGRLRWTPWGPCWGPDRPMHANMCPQLPPDSHQPPPDSHLRHPEQPSAPHPAPTLRPPCAHRTPTGRPKSIPYSIYSGFSDFQDPGGPGHGQPGFTCPLVRGIPC